jgi:hypothetical protein
MRHPGYITGLVALLWLGGCAQLPTTPKSQPAPVSAPTGPAPPAVASPLRTAAEDPKNGPCIQTTHGCVALNPDVDEDTVDATICVSGYTRSVRPATSYTNAVKKKLMQEAGIGAVRMSDFELDHIVPLALGGHPRKVSNLMLQPWEGEHGAKMKDLLEVRLQALVCHGKLDLTDAQACIAENWEACAAQYPRR